MGNLIKIYIKISIMDLIGRKRGDFAQFKNGKKLPFDHKIFNI
jgi:hypothetical protein